MKKYILSFLLVLVLASSVQVLHGYNQPLQETSMAFDKQRYLRRTYGGILKTATSRMAQHLMGEIAPQSGKELRYKVYLEQIAYDEKENCVAANVYITWQARDWFSNVPYGECQIQGTIYVYIPMRNIDNTKVYLDVASYNEHLSRVSKPQHIRSLESGVIINI
ncbi:hypothetical protein [Porphyromonas gingivicanis]|uniref:hypothetical protein n=1 Tax=Porphyromonas gingivicanis TaxID=266762 RepID=UPI000470EE3A|nr:hypothetical protein [Porphyromonas gingivicanis]